MLAVVLACAPLTEAHVPRGGKGTVTQIVFGPRLLRLTVDLGYDANWARSEMVRMDRDRDGKTSAEEAKRYTELQWQKRVLPGLQGKLDGAVVEFRKVAQRYEGPLGQPRSTPISFYYELEVGVPTGPDTRDGGELPLEKGANDSGQQDPVDEGQADEATRERTFELETLAFRDPIRYPPLFVVPFVGHAPGAEPGLALEPKFEAPERMRLEAFGYLLEGPRFVVRYRFRPGVPTVPVGVPPPEASGPSPPQPPVERNVDKAGSLRPDDPHGTLPDSLGPVVLLRWLAIAFLWGVAWTLSPAPCAMAAALHGLAVKRPLRDAFTLGVLTATVHAATTLLLGWNRRRLANEVLLDPGLLNPGLLDPTGRLGVASGAAAGAILFFLGTRLFWRHWGAGPDAWKPRRGELLLLALAAGLPVGAGAAPVIARALESPAHTLFATALTLAFALGTGVTVTTVSAVLLSGRPLVLPNKTGRAAQGVAILVGLFLAALGAFLLASLIRP